MKVKILSFFCCMCLSLALRAQEIPIGQWRTHLNYYNTVLITEAESRIYASSTNGLFYFDRESLEVKELTKIDGLSDNNISSLAYSPALGTLLVAYRNGNIDLIEKNRIVNVRTLLNSGLRQTDILDSFIDGQTAYLATIFGVVVLDISRYRIVETYQNIGLEGRSVAVTGIDATTDSLYLATAEGLKTASIDPSVNRLDFRSWNNRPLNDGAMQGVGVNAEGQVYVHDGSTVYRYFSGNFQPLNGIASQPGTRFNAGANQLLATNARGIFALSGQTADVLLETTDEFLPTNALTSANGTIWIATTANGLIELTANGTTNSRFPDGPFANSVAKLALVDGRIAGISGSIGTGFPTDNREGFSLFENGRWANYVPGSMGQSFVNLPDIADITSLAFVPSEGKLFVGSFQSGLWQLDLAEGTALPDTQIPLRPSTLGNNSISTLYTDISGSLWVGNYGVANGTPSVHRRSAAGMWNAVLINGGLSSFPADILVDDFLQTWVLLSSPFGTAIAIFDEDGRQVYIGGNNSLRDLPNAQINCLAKDQQGRIWVGTMGGVAEFLNPGLMLTASGGNATLPRFENRPLLEDEQITAIAVDGGNRKWMGTQNGLWVFSPNGNRLIHHFTEDNSPLLSNQIIDVEIIPATGEVFIATSQGLVSYRSGATNANQFHQTVKIFPNPVPPQFEGQVGISGLARNARVRITDINGNLIWDTEASGGTATWNARDYNGRRAATGAYLIFSSSENAEDTYVGKVLVVN